MPSPSPLPRTTIVTSRSSFAVLTSLAPCFRELESAGMFIAEVGLARGDVPYRQITIRKRMGPTLKTLAPCSTLTAAAVTPRGRSWAVYRVSCTPCFALLRARGLIQSAIWCCFNLHIFAGCPALCGALVQGLGPYPPGTYH